MLAGALRVEGLCLAETRELRVWGKGDCHERARMRDHGLRFERQQIDTNAAPEIGKGTIRTQWVRCGKPWYRCVHGELHGPYFHLLCRENGRRRTCLRSSKRTRDQRKIDFGRGRGPGGWFEEFVRPYEKQRENYQSRAVSLAEETTPDDMVLARRRNLACELALVCNRLVESAILKECNSQRQAKQEVKVRPSRMHVEQATSRATSRRAT